MHSHFSTNQHVTMKSLAILTIAASIALAVPRTLAEEKEPAQVTAIKSMHGMLTAGKYGDFYRDWCHPHLQGQLSAEAFGLWMQSDKGKAVVALYAEVIRGVDSKAGADVLIAQPQAEKNQYEFILAAVRKQKSFERAGAQWYLEIQLHEGKWKLVDTD